MIDDIKTMVWKETKELLLRQGSFKGGMVGFLVFFLALGIYLPWTLGRSFVEQPYVLLIWMWMPLLLVMSVVVDSFAGERERHTLETLLASRLSDRAILFGKILTSVIYGWGMTMMLMLIGLVTVNIAYGKGQLLMFPLSVGLLIIALTLLISSLMASAGVLVSLRASTVRQAQQTLSMGIMAVALIPVLIFFVIPDSIKKPALDALMGLNMTGIAIGALLLLVAVNAIILYAAMLRFKRARLILD